LTKHLIALAGFLYKQVTDDLVVAYFFWATLDITKREWLVQTCCLSAGETAFVLDWIVFNFSSYWEHCINA